MLQENVTEVLQDRRKTVTCENVGRALRTAITQMASQKTYFYLNLKLRFIKQAEAIRHQNVD